MLEKLRNHQESLVSTKVHRQWLRVPTSARILLQKSERKNYRQEQLQQVSNRSFLEHFE